MPFIIARVNTPVTREQEIALKSRLGKAIEAVPGKSEEYLMVGIEADYHFYLRGAEQKAAYIEVSIFGNEAHLGYDTLSEEITQAIEQELHIPPENVYIKFDDITAWSVNGFYIDRAQFRQG